MAREFMGETRTGTAHHRLEGLALVIIRANKKEWAVTRRPTPRNDDYFFLAAVAAGADAAGAAAAGAEAAGAAAAGGGAAGAGAATGGVAEAAGAPAPPLQPVNAKSSIHTS